MFHCTARSYLEPVTDHEERVQLFMRAGEQDPDLPYAPLLE